MGADVNKPGDKGQRPLGAAVVGCAIWNPAIDESVIWKDATSFYAFGTDAPANATLEAWVKDANGTEKFHTTSFWTAATGFPGDIPPSAAGADWACLCTGLDQTQPGTFFIQVTDGGQGQMFSQRYSIVVQTGGNGGQLDAAARGMLRRAKLDKPI
jgi:hypothetical protein